MKLVLDTRSQGWEAHRIENTPIGIEKLDRGCWLVYRAWGGQRAYVTETVTRYGQTIRETRFFSSRAKALDYAREEVARYFQNVVVSA